MFRHFLHPYKCIVLQKLYFEIINSFDNFVSCYFYACNCELVNIDPRLLTMTDDIYWSYRVIGFHPVIISYDITQPETLVLHAVWCDYTVVYIVHLKTTLTNTLVMGQWELLFVLISFSSMQHINSSCAKIYYSRVNR